MEHIKRTVQETIKYFRHLSHLYEVDAHRSDDPITKAQAKATAEAYELAAFEVERNMKC